MDLPPNSVNVIQISLSSIHWQHLTKYLTFDPKKVHLLFHFCTLECTSCSIRGKKHISRDHKGNTYVLHYLTKYCQKVLQDWGKKKSCIFSRFSALQGCGTMKGKNRESSSSQAITGMEVVPFPPLTKPWRTTSWTFCWLLHCPKNQNISHHRGEWMEWREVS